MDAMLVGSWPRLLGLALAMIAGRTGDCRADEPTQAEVERLVDVALKKRAEEKKRTDDAAKAEAEAQREESLYGGTRYDLFALYDNLTRPEGAAKKWYDRLSIRGYTQIRYGNTMEIDDGSAPPFHFNDRFINGNAENFGIRRARFILFGDVSEYLSLYAQVDLANALPLGTNAYNGQMRDLYGDAYFNSDRVHRIRIGLSKVPYGFENMQSSQNRVTLDRSDALNSGVPGERDLGAFYYYTPTDMQKLFRTLVDSGLKGSGNYGMFAFGVYNGQALALEANDNLMLVSRITYPFQLPNDQVVEVSLQGYTGKSVVSGAAIRPLGKGPAITPKGTGGSVGIRDQRAAASFIWYPQPWGFQAEWQVGQGPGLNNQQTTVVERSLNGGYALVMYRHETESYGNITPYARYQQYSGGYKSAANAPFGQQREWDLGVEWQIRKEMELTLEYDFVDTPNLNAQSSGQSYRNFRGQVLRAQFQINY